MACSYRTQSKKPDSLAFFIKRMALTYSLQHLQEQKICRCNKPVNCCEALDAELALKRIQLLSQLTRSQRYDMLVAELCSRQYRVAGDSTTRFDLR
jgi:hypothetical protein